ncbi:MAG: GNAT family N-acetyltransferase [Aminobacteriaceae bacterium]|jgi:RimJ/RimL family protein N-acetyltransferase|nr:GNAT family N-acetyltransferase [Synergistaceae bacterium]MDD4613363.1 GNAT family N-acetyltransferase [Synergistaceae bacterium]
MQNNTETRRFERIETQRLIFRRPHREDAEAIFTRYASDPEVTRFLGWPRHKNIDDSLAFIEMSDKDWCRFPAGPYLVESRKTGELLGSSGFAFETALRASLGYVFACDAWGKGYATEAALVMKEIGRMTGLIRLYALCHVENLRSARVLEKSGFLLEGTLRKHYDFPNIGDGGPGDVCVYGMVFSEREVD